MNDQTEENKNIIGNMMKNKMGATVTQRDDKQPDQSLVNGKAKGRRKVKKTREVVADGYT